MTSDIAPLKNQAANAPGGWQIILADLALILFMITAAALANTPANTPESAQSPFKPSAAPQVPPTKPIAASFRGEPVAVWTDAEGVPPLGHWLASEGSDARLRATIVVRFTKGQQSAAFSRAKVLLQQAGNRGANARIVVEAGPSDGAVVTLAYDLEQMAR
jgi:hypothetical protein